MGSMPLKKSEERYCHECMQLTPSRPNEVSSYDFIFDACANSDKVSKVQ